MCEIGLAKIYSCTKFDVSSFIHSRFMEEGFKFKIWALEMGLAKVYPYIEFEVPTGINFTCSRFTEGGLKFKNSAPGP